MADKQQEEWDCMLQVKRILLEKKVVCPSCKSENIGTVERGYGTANKRMRIFQCRSCAKQFSDTSETALCSSHLPFSKWLSAIMYSQFNRGDFTILGLQKHLRCTYRTATRVKKILAGIELEKR